MCTEKELAFCTFIFYSLSEAWNTTPAEVYRVLNTTHILDGYIIEAYDVLHTLGREYLIEDISELVRENKMSSTVYKKDDKDRVLGVYKRELEDSIILNIAKVKNIGVRKAMDMYYSSSVAVTIADMKELAGNMDANKLARAVIRRKAEFER